MMDFDSATLFDNPVYLPGSQGCSQAFAAPQGFSGALARNFIAIALVFDARIGNKAASAMSTAEFPHSFSP
jgi:hypothetical protein